MNRRQLRSPTTWMPLALACWLFVASASGQSPEIDRIGSPPQDDETVLAFQLRARAELPAADLKAAKTEVTLAETKQAVAGATGSVAVPSGFAGRVNASLADFLPFFQFGVDTLTSADDGRSVTMEFNPFRVGSLGALNLKVTAVEPVVFQPLLDAIVEPARPAQKEALAKATSDFDNLILTATYGFQRSDDGETWDTARKRFGRNPELYRTLVGDLVESALEPAFKQTEEARASAARRAADLGEKLAALAPDGEGDVDAMTFGEIRTAIKNGTLSGFDLDEYVAALRADAGSYVALTEELAKVSFDQLAFLIGNQPQLTFSGSRNTLDENVGPDSWVVTASYELGNLNFNRLLREYRWRKNRLSEADKAKVGADRDELLSRLRREAYEELSEKARVSAQDKFTFSVTYKDLDAYVRSYAYQETVTDPVSGAQTTLDRTAVLNLPASKEFTYSLQWSRFDRWKSSEAVSDLTQKLLDLAGTKAEAEEEAPSTAKPQILFAVDYLDPKDDPTRQSRFIGRLTYTLPAGGPGGTSLPITLTYANRSEFLGEQDHVLSAHVGLSFKRTGGKK